MYFKETEHANVAFIYDKSLIYLWTDEDWWENAINKCEGIFKQRII